MTEVGIVLSNPYSRERRPGTVGMPLPGVELRITDPVGGADVEPGAVGEVRIRGASVFVGYLHRPEATEAAIGDGWMHTGDFGCLDDDGYVHLKGRAADLIISGGFNVYPAEVESVLSEHPSVAEVAAYGCPDPDLGEVVHCAIVLDKPATDDELMTWARAALSPIKLPRVLRRVESLPRNSMGKVQKRSLRSRVAPTSDQRYGGNLREDR